jgi:hypothetical protein
MGTKWRPMAKKKLKATAIQASRQVSRASRPSLRVIEPSTPEQVQILREHAKSLNQTPRSDVFYK